ncbi:MAG TPA: MBL fold metallo-hydrolase, partial [Bryobacteraceae bacterium]
IPHDAIDPVGFCFRSQGIKVGVVTDLGYVPDSIKFHLRGADLLILESNHDLEMLKVGPYPWSVKQRVMGRKGHLSNDVVSEFIARDLDTSVSTLVLGHLSEHNNHPEIVRNVAARALDRARRSLFTRLVVAEPRGQSEVFSY